MSKSEMKRQIDDESGEPAREVRIEHEALTMRCNELEQAVEELESRLGDYLMPMDISSTPNKEDRSSPMGARLHEDNARLQHIRERIVCILEQLAI